ncbi:MmsAB operon regulatory protein [Thalassotalea insulae]|uniref:MmsAB operon regulatory protein n=1 Tax=Thalassotalea insulae TaxID=2056778 RepID=A0ABQ6GW22_9GAMM|nr:AraC family transcriptional regulator [Thalassotalea insulae]GLX79874.1 MmsAB operon regulatory protein [Thalassotalea insulae]
MSENNKLTDKQDIRLIIPLFLLRKLKEHTLTSGLYPISLGKYSQSGNYQISQQPDEQYSLIYCQFGQGNLHYKNKVRTINRGDLVLIPPHQMFSYQGKSKHGVYWINFTGKLADDFAERLLMKMDDGLAHVGIQSNIIADFDYLLNLGSRGYTATNVIHAVHLLQQALSFLALQLRTSAFNKATNFDLEAIENLMRNNLHQELNLDVLAHYSQLSKFHFAKKFKELTDTSPIQHFINLKIQQACFQLDNSEQTIKSIAETLGYNDPYYFSRLFKKIVGMSPKQYRDSRHHQ